MAGTPGHGDPFPLTNSISQNNEYSQMTVNEHADPDSISVNMQNAHDDPGIPANRAAFALYRPEPPNHTRIPLDSQTAVKKYRMDPPQNVFSDDKRER